MRLLAGAMVGILFVVGPLMAEGGPSRTLERAFPLASGDDLAVYLKVGELAVVTAPIDEVRVQVSATCRPRSMDKCDERLEGIEVEASESADGTLVKVTGVSKRYSKMNVRARFVVPQDSPLTVRMYAGEARIEGLGQDLEVRLKFGDVKVRQPLSTTRSVLADANIGDAEVFTEVGHPEPSRPLLVGSKVRWDEGPGEAGILVKLGAGSITVHLD